MEADSVLFHGDGWWLLQEGRTRLRIFLWEQILSSLPFPSFLFLLPSLILSFLLRTHINTHIVGII